MKIWILIKYDDGTDDYIPVVQGAKMDENEPGEFDYGYDLHPTRTVASIGITVTQG